MDVSRQKIESPPPASWSARFAAALAIALAFFIIGHSFNESKKAEYGTGMTADNTENEYAAQQKETTATSVIGFFMLGGMGLAFWAASESRGINLRHPLVVLCIIYVGWCSMSLLWSTDPMQSMRKLTIMVLMLTGAYGLASKFELEDLVWIVALTMTVLIIVGILTEVALGTCRPWQRQYRFAGTCHPNDQGLQCALLVVAAVFLEWTSRNRPWLRRAFIVLGLVGLALSKSRTTLVSFVAAAAIALVMRTHGLQRWLVSAVALTLLCAVGLAASFGSVAALNETANIAVMGRHESLSSLTGRLPLWTELWKAAQTHLWAGHGFGAFWTERSVLKYSQMLKWHIPHAHNSYLDMILAVGLVGLMIHFISFFATTITALLRYDENHRPAELFAICYLAFSLVHGASESKLPGFGMAGFILLAVMAMIAVQEPLSKSTAAVAPAETAPRWRQAPQWRRPARTMQPRRSFGGELPGIGIRG